MNGKELGRPAVHLVVCKELLQREVQVMFADSGVAGL